MDNGKVQILKTNLQPSFWRKLRKILKQNKKEVLLQFLFGTGYSSQPSSSYLEDQIQTLQNQVNSLQQKVIQLEAKLMRVEQNSKYPLSEPSQPLESSKTTQQGPFYPGRKKGALFDRK
jgi:acetoin utilization deacetylase AcuC-like enzyme